MDWNGKPFYPVSEFYKNRFGSRVKKIPVTIADDCPNRRGLKGMQACVFCDEWGSAAYPEQRGQDLESQIRGKRDLLASRYRAAAFLVYFQAYTSTFLAVRRLEACFETALSFPDVKGLVVGTRPDCLSPAVLELWARFHRRSFVSVELGVQSFFDSRLAFLRRGHDARTAIQAIHRIKNESDADLCIHLIFGLPGETDEEIRQTAGLISNLPVDHVKLHHLHVLKNTPLEKLYRQGEFQPLELESYADRVILFLRYLSPRISVHRLVALSSRWEELVAPEWTRHKMRCTQFIVDRMKATGAYQGANALDASTRRIQSLPCVVNAAPDSRFP